MPEFTQDWTTPHTANWLKWLGHLVGRPNTFAVEIGCYEGRSSRWFMENILTGPGSRLFCYDIFDGNNGTPVDPGIEIRFRANTAGLNVTLIREVFGGSRCTPIQFIYVDGSHRAWDVLRDLVYSWDELAPDGVMIMDDYGWEYFEPETRPKVAIDAWLAINAGRYRMIEKGFQVCVRKYS